MSAVQTDILPVLHRLVATLTDGADCFRLAAEDARSEEIHAFFDRLCRQRSQFAADIMAIAAKIGAPSFDQTAGGDLIRGFLDDRTLLSECERHELDAALAYQRTLAADDLPVTLRQVLERHLAEIAETTSQLQRWEVGAVP